MFDPQNRILFIHIPKTGGTSIERAMGANLPPLGLAKSLMGWGGKHRSWRQHLTIAEIKKFYKTIDLHNCFKFTIVRNPWDRMVSSFRWEQRGFRRNRSKAPSNFKEFTISPRWYNKQHSKHQLDFITNENLKIEVDFIGRFENLQEDFNTALVKGDALPKKLPHKNKTKRKHYTEYYDDETKQIVAEKYAKDIEYFGYEFGE